MAINRGFRMASFQTHLFDFIISSVIHLICYLHCTS